MSEVITTTSHGAKRALVMAGGTGGHIFPALALARGLQAAGWQVTWLGAPASMEQRIIGQTDITLELVEFSGVRGKGFKTLLALPWRLAKALQQSWNVIRRIEPQVVVGFGGYITFPAGMVAALSGTSLVLHEQNSVAGSANKVLARFAKRVFSAFPDVLPRGEWVGNPLRAEFLQQTKPEQRYRERSGPLKLLVIGGSLGAKALNDCIPAALALMPVEQRPQVVHQSGEKQIDALRLNYQTHGVEAELIPFIEDTAEAMAKADIVIARAGASTVCEIAAVGVAAQFVPFPHATDDHQTTNAAYLVKAGAAWMTAQNQLNAQNLAQWLSGLQRDELCEKAIKAQTLAQTHAVASMVQACEAEITKQVKTSIESKAI